MIRTPHLLVLATAAAAGLAAPAAAEAGRVAVLTVQGDPDGELEDGLIAIVEDRHDLVTSGEFERAARRAGLDELDAAAIGKVARKLDADAVIEGQLSREDEGFTLVVRVRAQSGKTIKKITVDLAKPRLSAKAKRRLGTGVLDGVDRVLGIADDGGDGGDDEARDDDGDGRKVSRARKKSRTAARELARDDETRDADDAEDADADAARDDDEDRGGDDDDRVAARDDEGEDDEPLGLRRDRGDRDDDRAPADPRRAALRVFAGVSATARNLAFTVRPDLDEAQIPNGTTTTFVPGARVDAELYPMAFGGKTGAASGLGVAVAFDQTLTLSTQTSDAPDQKFPTAQRAWSVGARYRWIAGASASAPTVTLGVGYGRRAFIVDRSALPADAEIDFPDTDYRYLDPGLTVRLPLGARLALDVGGKAYLIRTAGAIQSESEYGGAKITGFTADGGLEVKVTRQAVLRLGASWAQIGFDFVGNGEQSNGRDDDLATQDVGGAMDRYIGVAGTLGVAY